MYKKRYLFAFILLGLALVLIVVAFPASAATNFDIVLQLTDGTIPVPTSDSIVVEVSGKGSFKDGGTFTVSSDQPTISYRIRRGTIVSAYLYETFNESGTWTVTVAQLTTRLWHDDNGNSLVDEPDEVIPSSDPATVEVSGVGQLQTGGTLYLPPNTDIAYRLRRGTIAGNYLHVTFAPGTQNWNVPFAAVHVLLCNGLLNGNCGPGDVFTPAEDAAPSVEISGVGQLQTGSTVYLPPNTDISYRLRRGTITGDYLHVDKSLADGNPSSPDPANIGFNPGYAGWYVHFATVHPVLWHDDNGNSLVDEPDEVIPSSDPVSVEISGVGQLQTGGMVHLPPNTDIAYRLRRDTIAGNYLHVTFAPGTQNWNVPFAAVHVLLCNGLLNGNCGPGDVFTPAEDAAPSVEISGVGQLQTGSTVYLPPNTDISYRLRRGTIAGNYLHVDKSLADGNPSSPDPANIGFNPGYVGWYVHFATVYPTLWNDDNGNDTLDIPDEVIPSSDPVSVEISGVGQLQTGGMVHLPPNTNIAYRLRRDTIAGNYLHVMFSTGSYVWPVEFATVTFTFQPGLPVNLADMMSTEVSGVGTIANNGTVHLPPDTTISFRARRNSWVTGWYTQSFYAGSGTVYWGMGPTYVGPTP